MRPSILALSPFAVHDRRVFFRDDDAAQRPSISGVTFSSLMPSSSLMN